MFDSKRTSKQCRARYMNHLDPDLRHEPWTAEENAALKAATEAYGERQIKWASIVKEVPELEGEEAGSPPPPPPSPQPLAPFFPLWTEDAR